MTARTRLKLTISLVGLVLFFAGVRLEMNGVRWAGLGLVAVAWLMRFWKEEPPPA